MTINIIHILAILFGSYWLGTIIFWVAETLPIALEKEWRIEALSFLGDEGRANILSDQIKKKPLWSMHSWRNTYDNKIRRFLKDILFRPSIWKKLLKRTTIYNIRPLRGLLCQIITIISSFSVFYAFGFSFHALLAAIFIFLIITISMVDVKHRLIPDALSYPLLWTGLIASSLHLWVSAENGICGAVVGYLILWLCSFLYSSLKAKDVMGHGDMKMLAALGAWFGLQSLGVILAFSCVFALCGILLQAIYEKSITKCIPFGPFLSMAGFVYLVAHTPIQNFIINLIK